MKRAIREHRWDFSAIIVIVLLAVGVSAYILDNQRVRFPLIEAAPYQVDVELQSAQAVTPGQGQSVRVAGVKIGDIGRVRLENGHAVVTLDIEPRFKDLVRRDSTALLRSRTQLKDMFVEIEPGDGPPLGDGARITAAQSAPDVNLDEVLETVDRDTRDHLKLLISGGSDGVEGRASDFREALRRLGPTHRDLARVSAATARRSKLLRRLVHRYGLLVSELGNADRDVVRLVQASHAVFSALAPEDESIARAVAELPGALRATRSALVEVEDLGRALGPASTALRPAVRSLDPAARALLPLAREATPVLRDEIRPLTRIAASEIDDAGVAAKRLNRAGPDLTGAVTKLNRLLNMLAFNPKGAEGLTGDLTADRDREEGALYWFAWTAQAGVSLFSTADGQGIFRRFTSIGADCSLLTSGGLPQSVADQLSIAGVCSPTTGNAR